MCTMTRNWMSETSEFEIEIDTDVYGDSTLAWKVKWLKVWMQIIIDSVLLMRTTSSSGGSIRCLGRRLTVEWDRERERERERDQWRENGREGWRERGREKEGEQMKFNSNKVFLHGGQEALTILVRADRRNAPLVQTTDVRLIHCFNPLLPVVHLQHINNADVVNTPFVHARSTSGVQMCSVHHRSRTWTLGHRLAQNSSSKLSMPGRVSTGARRSTQFAGYPTRQVIGLVERCGSGLSMCKCSYPKMCWYACLPEGVRVNIKVANSDKKTGKLVQRKRI